VPTARLPQSAVQVAQTCVRLPGPRFPRPHGPGGQFTRLLVVKDQNAPAGRRRTFKTEQ